MKFRRIILNLLGLAAPKYVLISWASLAIITIILSLIFTRAIEYAEIMSILVFGTGTF